MFLKPFQVFSLRNSASSSLVLSRTFAFKSELKIKWFRPEKIPSIKPENSGDLEPFKYPDQTRLLLKFEKSEELQSADDLVKNMFTLNLNRRKESTAIVKEEFVDRVKRHDFDWGSMECKIAKMTVQIRAMQEAMDLNPKNRVVKVQLKEMIDKRKKFLRYLRRWDYKRFEWLLEKCNIVYRPYPEKFHWITRKESLRKLTDTHCETVREEKLAAYRKTLEAEQLDFLDNKIKNLEFIRQEQVDCRVPVTITVEEIESVKKQFADLKYKREEEEKVTKLQSEKEDYEMNL